MEEVPVEEVAVVEKVALALAVQVEDKLEGAVVAVAVQLEETQEVVEDKLEVVVLALQV